jgi:hypothetical protein
VAALLRRTTLDPAAAFRETSTLDEDGDQPQPPVGNAAIQPRAPFRPHTALELKSRGAGTALAIHVTESAASPMFVPAESTEYISRP